MELSLRATSQALRDTRDRLLRAQQQERQVWRKEESRLVGGPLLSWRAAQVREQQRQQDAAAAQLELLLARQDEALRTTLSSLQCERSPLV